MGIKLTRGPSREVVTFASGRTPFPNQVVSFSPCYHGSPLVHLFHFAQELNVHMALFELQQIYLHWLPVASPSWVVTSLRELGAK